MNFWLELSISLNVIQFIVFWGVVWAEFKETKNE